MLDESVQRSAVWLAAGPGAGKSTLAASWASARNGRVLWYRADEGDADPAVSFTFFTELARTTGRSKFLPSFTARDLDRLDLFARAFLRAFFARTPAASTIVIDDAHAAAGTAFDTLLAALIAEAPHDIAVLVLSRHDPNGSLLECVSRGTLELLDGSALAFTPDEANDLLAERMDPAAVRRLHARVQGWAAGMLLLSHASNADEQLIASERLASYFDERVLAQFDTAGLRTLAAVSLLPEVDSADLPKLGLDDDAVDLLERLRKRHAFVARLDRQPPSWRLHDLLRDALHLRFDAIGDLAWRQDTRRAAAGIATAKGLARDAVALWLRCGRATDALRTAERFARPLVRAQRLGELDAVAAMLAPEIVQSSLPLQLALGESAWQRNQARVAADRFECAFALLHEPSPSATALIIAATAVNAIFEGWQDYEGTGRWVARLREHLAARPAIVDASEGLRVDSVCLRAMSMIWGEELGNYRELVDRVLHALSARDAIAPEDAVGASTVLVEAAAYHLSNQQLFYDTLEATSPWLFRPDLPPLALAAWLSAFAPLAMHWPVSGVKLPATDQVTCLELAIALAREHGGRSIAYTATTFLVNAAVAGNDLAAASRHLEVLRELADPAHVSQVHAVFMCEASVCALKGEWVRARQSFDRAIELARTHGFPPSECWSQELGRARVDIASGRFDDAHERLLRAAEGFPAGMRKDFALILADIAKAGEALARRDEIPAALVESIMGRADAYSWRGFATLLAPLAARLCADAVRLGIVPEFARRVVQERNLAAPDPYEPHWPWPIRIHALGELRVLVGDTPLAFGARAQRKPLDLLKAIIAHGPAPVDSAVILDALWPDAEGAAARAAFDMTLMRLRKLLQRDDALKLDAGRIALDLHCVWVDAYAFAHGTIEDYPGALFGNDAIEPWWAAARERLHQRFLRRTVERGRTHEKARELDLALQIYEAGLAQDPLAEDLYQGAIRCHLACDRPADALRVFRRCREQLSIVLSVAPSPATTALVAGVSTR